MNTSARIVSIRKSELAEIWRIDRDFSWPVLFLRSDYTDIGTFIWTLCLTRNIISAQGSITRPWTWWWRWSSSPPILPGVFMSAGTMRMWGPGTRWLVNTGHVTWILAWDWSIAVTWPEYWPVIGCCLWGIVVLIWVAIIFSVVA